MKNSWLTILIALVLLPGIQAQQTDFLPSQTLWNVQCLDPLASQVYGKLESVWEGNEPADYVLAGFSFGFQRAVVRWDFPSGNALELGMEGGAITQFEFTDRTGVFHRSIVSTDFLAGIPLIWYGNPWTLRMRVFHLSAHTGDDYLILNEIRDYHPNNNNYEQLDFTLNWPVNERLSLQIGAGSVIRDKTPRKPLYFSAGAEYRYPLGWRYNTQFYAGVFIDSRQDHGFRPAVQMGAGLQIGKEENRAYKIMLTYFNGPLPYSVYIGEPRQWLGAAFYFNPF